VEAFRKFVLDALVEDSAMLTLEVLRRARLNGYQGSKSAMYSLVASVRPRDTRPVVRFEGLPGEFSQHDFGHVDVRFVDGGKKRVHFFASRLKYSRAVAVSLVPDERVESLVRSLIAHLDGFGGIPLLAVFDRPKTIAIHWAKDGQVTQWNPTFAGVVLDLGLGVELCWPRCGNQKGAVENLVRWVKGSFFKPRRFLDMEDLDQQLAEWHQEVNHRLPSRATGVVPAVRLAEEQKRLRSLKVRPEELALRIPVVVGPTAEVNHDTHRYSMPAEAIGFSGTLYLYPDKVRIVAGRFEVVHVRLFEKGAKASLPEHRAELLAAVSGKRGRRYLQRQQLLDVGEAAMLYLTEITHRRPMGWSAEVDSLHALLQRHGPGPLRQAFARAIEEEVYGHEYVRHFLAACEAQGGRENGPARSSSERPPELSGCALGVSP
jgi:transposase